MGERKDKFQQLKFVQTVGVESQEGETHTSRVVNKEPRPLQNLYLDQALSGESGLGTTTPIETPYPHPHPYPPIDLGRTHFPVGIRRDR